LSFYLKRIRAFNLDKKNERTQPKIYRACTKTRILACGASRKDNLMDGPRQLEGQGTGQGRRHDDCRTTGRPGGVPGQSEARGGMRLTSRRRGGASGERRNPKAPPSPQRLCRHLSHGGLAGHAGGGGMPLRRGVSPQEQRAARAGRVRVDASTVLLLPRWAGSVVRGRAGAA
jgi:hypothetical protein